MTETPHSSGDAEPRRRRRILPRVLFASLATVLLLEVTLRALLFVPAMRGAGERLRDPASFAHRWTDDYWKLKYTFAGPTERLAARHDPITGCCTSASSRVRTTTAREPASRGNVPFCSTAIPTLRA